MDIVQLMAEKRDGSVKAADLRRADLIPAECYGGGKENISLQMEYQVFRKAYISAGESTVIDLKVGDGAPMKVLVHSVTFDPVSDKISHVDFMNVDMNVEVHTHIPLEFVGVAPAVKDLSGTLMTALTELEVKCLPGDLLHSIEVDISGLVDFHTAIHVKDLIVSDRITVVTDLERTVANVIAPRVEEPETPVGAEAAAGGAEAAVEGGEEAGKEE